MMHGTMNVKKKVMLTVNVKKFALVLGGTAAQFCITGDLSSQEK